MSGSRSPGSYMNIVDQEVDSTMDVLGKNAVATEWTDEKHGLYLKSMEASFVNQLYDSINSQGGSLQRRHDSASNSSRHLNTRTTGQFKVHQNGSWQKLNFERARPRADGTDEHRYLLENPRIRHFRSGDRQDAPFRIPQETAAVSGSQPGTSGFANMPPQLVPSSNHQVSSCNNEEASDQNFIDEDDDEHGEENVSHRTKRSRTSESGYTQK